MLTKNTLDAIALPLERNDHCISKNGNAWEMSVRFHLRDLLITLIKKLLSVHRVLRLSPVVVILFWGGSKAQAQFYAVNADLAGWATGTLNAGVSMEINMKWSLHLPVQYNPWTFSDNKKFKHLTVQPGVRYWFDQSFEYGWFIGMHAFASRFNVGGVFGSNYRYNGAAYGLGLSGGFSLPIAKFWNLEFELGGSGVYSNHDKYDCIRCGNKLSEKKGFYVVPTKAAVNLVYLF